MVKRLGSPPRILPDDDVGRDEAISVLQAGGLVALPTDTVYGLAVRLTTPGGIERLFRAKARPIDKGIALLLGRADQAGEVGIPNGGSNRLAAAFWPGPLTLVLPRNPLSNVPDVLTGGVPTIGVRLPDHQAPRTIASVVGPLPTTSANRSGGQNALDVSMVIAQLGNRVDLILDGGPTPGPMASTVVDCTGSTPVVLREGLIETARIMEAWRGGVD